MEEKIFDTFIVNSDPCCICGRENSIDSREFEIKKVILTACSLECELKINKIY